MLELSYDLNLWTWWLKEKANRNSIRQKTNFQLEKENIFKETLENETEIKFKYESY